MNNQTNVNVKWIDHNINQSWTHLAPPSPSLSFFYGTTALLPNRALPSASNPLCPLPRLWIPHPHGPRIIRNTVLQRLPRSASGSCPLPETNNTLSGFYHDDDMPRPAQSSVSPVMGLGILLSKISIMSAGDCVMRPNDGLNHELTL